MGVRVTCQGLLITFMKLVLQLRGFNVNMFNYSDLYKPHIYVDKFRKLKKLWIQLFKAGFQNPVVW